MFYVTPFIGFIQLESALYNKLYMLAIYPDCVKARRLVSRADCLTYYVPKVLKPRN